MAMMAVAKEVTATTALLPESFVPGAGAGVVVTVVFETVAFWTVGAVI